MEQPQTPQNSKAKKRPANETAESHLHDNLVSESASPASRNTAPGETSYARDTVANDHTFSFYSRDSAWAVRRQLQYERDHSSSSKLCSDDRQDKQSIVTALLEHESLIVAAADATISMRMLILRHKKVELWQSDGGRMNRCSSCCATEYSLPVRGCRMEKVRWRSHATSYSASKAGVQHMAQCYGRSGNEGKVE